MMNQSLLKKNYNLSTIVNGDQKNSIDLLPYY